MNIKRKKLSAIIVSIILAICCLLSGCADKTPQITRDYLIQKVESYAETYIAEYKKEEPIVMDGQEFDFEAAFEYGNQFFNKDWDKYGECMNAIKSSLSKDSARLATIYSNYVEAVNAVSDYDKTDAFEYKPAVSGALISMEVAKDVTKLIKDINTDTDLLKTIGDIAPIELSTYNFYDTIKIENAEDKNKYFNDFGENFVTAPYLSQNQSKRMSAFLKNYDIEIGRVGIEGATGVTYFNNGVADRLVINENYGLFGQMNILIHEMGHVSDVPYDLVSGESVADTTALLSSFYARELNYGNLSEPIVPLVYEQSIYAFVMSHVFGYGEVYGFCNNIYSQKSKLTEADILSAYDKELNSAASGFSEGNEIFWQINWKNAAYNDIINMGREYLYAALNAVYIWDLYAAEKTRETAIMKYQSLLENKRGFDKLDDMGLIGDSNIVDAYSPLKNFVIKNYETIIEIYKISETDKNN